jgi:hypothetical protein
VAEVVAFFRPDASALLRHGISAEQARRSVVDAGAPLDTEVTLTVNTEEGPGWREHRLRYSAIAPRGGDAVFYTIDACTGAVSESGPIPVSLPFL